MQQIVNILLVLMDYLIWSYINLPCLEPYIKGFETGQAYAAINTVLIVMYDQVNKLK